MITDHLSAKNPNHYFGLHGLIGDDPADGDYELLADLIADGKAICSAPLKVECLTTTGKRPSQVGDNVVFSPTTGCVCDLAN